MPSILPTAGGPSVIIHGLIALGAAIAALAVKAIKMFKHA